MYSLVCIENIFVFDFCYKFKMLVLYCISGFYFSCLFTGTIRYQEGTRNSILLR